MFLKKGVKCILFSYMFLNVNTLICRSHVCWLCITEVSIKLILNSELLVPNTKTKQQKLTDLHSKMCFAYYNLTVCANCLLKEEFLCAHFKSISKSVQGVSAWARCVTWQLLSSQSWSSAQTQNPENGFFSPTYHRFYTYSWKWLSIGLIQMKLYLIFEWVPVVIMGQNWPEDGVPCSRYHIPTMSLVQVWQMTFVAYHTLLYLYLSLPPCFLLAFLQLTVY